jgi:hypothetical protein
MRQANIAERQAKISDRQAHIMERQTGIAAQQAETEQTRLRAELYDRRVIIYSGIESYLIDASSDDGKVSNEVKQELFKSISVASFLLDDEISSIGRKVMQVSASLRANMRRLDKLTDELEREGMFDKIEANNDDLSRLHIALRSHMTKYLKLSLPTDPPAHPSIG